MKYFMAITINSIVISEFVIDRKSDVLQALIKRKNRYRKMQDKNSL